MVLTLLNQLRERIDELNDNLNRDIVNIKNIEIIKITSQQ